MKKILSYIKLHWKRLWCKHSIQTVKYKCYQDRYCRTVCDDCGLEIFEDL